MIHFSVRICGMTIHTLLFIYSLTASFLLENGAKTKPESEAPQRQEEPLISQGPFKTRP